MQAAQEEGTYLAKRVIIFVLKSSPSLDWMRQSRAIIIIYRKGVMCLKKARIGRIIDITKGIQIII